MFENPRSCFSLDQDGNEVMTFDEADLDYQSVLMVHRISTMILCFIGLAINGLLLAIIIRNPNNLCNLRGVVMFGCLLDTTLCTAWLMSVPFTYAGYSRCINVINNGLHIRSPLVNTLLLASTVGLTMGSWAYSTFLFVYRLHFIRHGTQPTRRRLFAYLLIPVFTASIYSFCVVSMWKFDGEGLDNSIKLLHHFGYLIQEAEIQEAAMNDPMSKMKFALFGLVMFANTALIVYCSLAIRRILHANAVISVATRRLNNDMDRVLLLNACLPFVCNIVPSSFITKKMSSCEYHPWSDVFCLFIVNLALVLAPICTIWFIRPYKRIAERWLGCGERRESSISDSSLMFFNMVSRPSTVLNPGNQMRASIATIGMNADLPLRAKPFVCTRMTFAKGGN